MKMPRITGTFLLVLNIESVVEKGQQSSHKFINNLLWIKQKKSIREIIGRFTVLSFLSVAVEYIRKKEKKVQQRL